MHLSRSLALAVCALLAATACTKADDKAAEVVASTPVTAPSSVAAASAPSVTYASCKAFDDAFHLLFDETSMAATVELKKNYARPEAGLKKIIAVLQAYAAALDTAKAGTQHPEFAKALDGEADGARLTIGLLESTGDGEQIHILWFRYRLHTGQETAKHCPTEWLVNYTPEEQARASLR
jgi:hypothetical protein